MSVLRVFDSYFEPIELENGLKRKLLVPEHITEKLGVDRVRKEIKLICQELSRAQLPASDTVILFWLEDLVSAELEREEWEQWSYEQYESRDVALDAHDLINRGD